MASTMDRELDLLLAKLRKIQVSKIKMEQSEIEGVMLSYMYGRTVLKSVKGVAHLIN